MNQREEYNRHRIFTCNELNISVNQYNWFRRLANKLQLKYIRSCNGYTQPFFEKQDEEREVIWCHQIGKKAEALKLFVYHQTDPRGASLYLAKYRINDENYHNAHCIY